MEEHEYSQHLTCNTDLPGKVPFSTMDFRSLFVAQITLKSEVISLFPPTRIKLFVSKYPQQFNLHLG